MSHCSSRCHSKRHISAINAAIQNGSATQAQACIATCHNAFKGFDTSGRNIFHVAAAAGKYELLEWLLEKSKASLNTKDKESGWTALHRAIFYGQITCALNLIKNGAMLSLKDNEGLTPIDLCVRDNMYMPFVQSSKEIGDHNVYTWGDNSSYTLGHGKESKSSSPEVIEVFRRRRLNIKQVLLSRYHSVYLMLDGAVYTCGHGRGGRLGLGHEKPTLQPSMVKLPQALQLSTDTRSHAPSEWTSSTLKVEAIAAGWDHTLLLGANGRVYCFGSNEHKQLGISTDSVGRVTEPKMVNVKGLTKGTPVRYIAAARFHSVIATDTEVYTMGLNVGQLGHAKGDKHIPPTAVTSLYTESHVSKVELAACGDACTVIVKSGEWREGFYVLYKYTTRFINFRGMKFDTHICRLSVCGGQIDQSTSSKSINKDSYDPLRIFWINKIGQLLLWTDDVIRRVVYPSLGRELSLYDVSCSSTEVLVTTEDGEAYILTDSNKSPPISKDTSKLPSAGPTTDMKIRRIAGVHRATQCSLDPKANNYALLQSREYSSSFADVRPSQMSDNLLTLLTTADEMDGICDVVVKCQGGRMPCHRFILASRSTYFNKSLSTLDSSAEHCSTNQERDEQFYIPSSVQELVVDIELDDLQFLLRYIYTGHNHVLNSECECMSSHGVITSAVKGANDRLQQRLTRIRDIGKKFGVNSLSSASGCKRCSTPTYMMSKHTQWCDVQLISLDGKELMCHKCVLVARMEYFQTMLTGHWSEGKGNAVKLELPIPYDILYAVILYVYTDECMHLQAQGIDIEFMVNVLVVADQLLLLRLKEICEQLIISQLTIDNVTQVYQLSITYQTEQLRDAALSMICLNMAEMLELSLLDALDMHCLVLLTSHYRDRMRCMSRRFLVRTSCGPSEEEMNLVVKEQEYEVSYQPKRSRRKTRTSSSSSIDSDVINTALEELQVRDGDFTEEFDVINRDTQPEAVQSLEIETSPTPSTAGNRGDCHVPTSPIVSPTVTSAKQDRSAPTRVGDGLPSLRDIMLQEEKATAKSPPARKVKGKQRYRTVSLDTSGAGGDGEKTASTVTAKSQPAWSTSVPVTAVTSLREVMRNEQSHLPPTKDAVSSNKAFKTKPFNANKTSGRQSAATVVDKVPAWSIPTSPTFPTNGHPLSPSHHNTAASPTCATSQNTVSTSSNLQQIIKQEVMETKERQRHSKKPLTNVQIEERAIEELKRKYEAMKKAYEHITVERVTHTSSAPLWRNRST